MTKQSTTRVLLALALLFVASKTDAGTSGTYGPLPGGGGSGTVTSITVANATALGALSAGSLSDGAVAFVQTLKASFILEASTATAVPLVNVAASGNSGHQWVRQLVRSPVWEVRTTWTIDPTNSTGLASDENDGVDATVPLLTYQEHARRLAQCDIYIASTTTVLGSMQAGDAPFYTYRSMGFTWMTFTGVPTVISTSTVTSYVAMTPNVATADDAELVDSSLPVSWTSSGALAKGVLLRRTNGTVAYWFALKDLGSKTLRMSQSVDINSTYRALAPGDTYQILQLPTILSMRITAVDPLATQFNLFEMKASGFFFPVPWFVNCYLTVNPNGIGGLFDNCAFDSGSGSLTGSLQGISFFAGAFKGTGATKYAVVGGVFDTEGNIVCFQGARLQLSNAIWNATQANAYDVTGGNANFFTDTGGRIHIINVIGGMGNTGSIFFASAATQIVWIPATVAIAASSSVAGGNIYRAGATLSASPIPLQADGNGVFQTQ